MYGSLSALIMVMLWLYCCMNLLLYGAEINAYFENQFRQAQITLWQMVKKILTDFSLCGIVRKDKSKALKAFQGIVSFQREGVSGCKPP